MNDLIIEIASVGSALLGFLTGVVFWTVVFYSIFEK